MRIRVVSLSSEKRTTSQGRKLHLDVINTLEQYDEKRHLKSYSTEASSSRNNVLLLLDLGELGKLCVVKRQI